jgi:toxin FitB
VILLDTNVVSELMRAEPEVAVLQWVDEQPVDDVYITAVTLAELLDAMVTDDLDHRGVAFDETAAAHYADIAAQREPKLSGKTTVGVVLPDNFG